MRQQSKGQTARSRFAKMRDQKCPIPGQPSADHRGERQRRREKHSRHDSDGERKPYVGHRPLLWAGEIYGITGTVGTEPGVGEPPRSRAPAGLKRCLLKEPRASFSSARAGWWQEERGQTRGKLPRHARGFLSRRVQGSRAWQCSGVGNAGARL